MRRAICVIGCLAGSLGACGWITGVSDLVEVEAGADGATLDATVDAASTDAGGEQNRLEGGIVDVSHGKDAPQPPPSPDAPGCSSDRATCNGGGCCGGLVCRSYGACGACSSSQRCSADVDCCPPDRC